MTYERFLRAATAALMIVIVTFMLTPSAGAQTYQTLYTFTGGADGGTPFAGLIIDAAGNLYGTTYYGGSGPCDVGTYPGCGTVFELAPTAGGGWTESVLYSFTGQTGWRPPSGLTSDAAGNLYGTTFWGNSINGNGAGWGLVFKLTPNPDGSWSESVLYGFTGAADGGSPVGGVILDATGSLYGTTNAGGTTTCLEHAGCGTVYKLTPNLDGTWTESVIYMFKGGGDGEWPDHVSLVFDAAGNLYGTTADGGGKGSCNWQSRPFCGTIFELTPNADGTWTEQVLHRFTGGRDGANPAGTLIFDKSGNLYGTTFYGGAHGYGNVFELTPIGDGTWKEKALHQFANKDGANAYAGLTFDAAGNLYGTTYAGGNISSCGGAGCGVVFELTPNAGGSWTQKLLHRFNGGTQGANPVSELIFDAVGNLYSTTSCWAATCAGAVFEITP